MIRHLRLGALIALLLLLGGYAAIQVYRLSRAATTMQTVTSPTTPLPTPSIPAAWPVYTSRQEGLSFRYPPDWVLERRSGSGPDSDAASVIGPDGALLLWNSAAPAPAGRCNAATTPHLFIHATDPLPRVPHTFALQLGGRDSVTTVAAGDGTGEPGVALRPGDTGACLYSSLFHSATGSRRLSLIGVAQSGAGYRPLTPAEISLFKTMLLSVAYTQAGP